MPILENNPPDSTPSMFPVLPYFSLTMVAGGSVVAIVGLVRMWQKKGTGFFILGIGMVGMGVLGLLVAHAASSAV